MSLFVVMTLIFFGISHGQTPNSKIQPAREISKINDPELSNFSKWLVDHGIDYAKVRSLADLDNL